MNKEKTPIWKVVGVSAQRGRELENILREDLGKTLNIADTFYNIIPEGKNESERLLIVFMLGFFSGKLM